MRGHPASADPGVYASDRLHLNARGHAIVGERGGPRAQRRDPGEGRGMNELQIDITEAEILADLCWPGPPPGEWAVPQPSARRATARSMSRRIRPEPSRITVQ